MLMWFWLPILLRMSHLSSRCWHELTFLIVGLGWVLYAGVPLAYSTVYRAIRAALPMRDMIPTA